MCWTKFILKVPSQFHKGCSEGAKHGSLKASLLYPLKRPLKLLK